MTALPFEVIELIIEAIAHGDYSSLPSIKACSLVCYNLSVICRKHIFANVIVNPTSFPLAPKFGWHHRATTATLKELLSTRPEIATHISNLDYHVTFGDLFNVAATTEILDKITRLKSFMLRFVDIEWNYSSLRPAFLRILRLPTLTEFNLEGVLEFAFKDLENCNIEEFGFNYISISTSPYDVPSVPIKLRRLEIGRSSSSAVLHRCKRGCANEHSFVDPSSIKILSIRPSSSLEMDDSLSVLRHCDHLESLHFYDADDWTPFHSLSAALEVSAAKTLRFLEVSYRVYSRRPGEDVYHGLSAEIAAMTNKNIIEDIKIDITIYMDTDCDRGDQWGMFDTALASEAGWPHLRTCSVTVHVFDSESVHGLEEALLHVGETQFPRLSSRRNLLFEFIVHNRSAAYRID